MTSGQVRAPWWGLEAIAAARPDAVWARGTRDVSYARLAHEVDAIRAALRREGVGVGSSVAVQLPPSLTLLWWLFALWSEGAQVLLLDARMKPAEARAVLDRIRPGHRVTSTASSDPLAGFVDEIEASLEPMPDGVRGDPEIALVQCSSGSTGRPKIIARTGCSLLADVDRHARNPGMLAAGERVLLLGSLTFAFALAAGVLLSLRVGGSLVMPSKMHPDAVLRRAREADVHAIFGVPFHFDLLAQAGGSERLPSLRLAISCGDALSATVKQRFFERCGVSIGQVYGMTEVGAVAVDLRGDLQPPAVGRLLPGVEVRVDDGELFIKTDRNPYLSGGHADRYREGWLRTFDRAEVDPRTNVLSLLGRADSVCNIGGLKVDLTEVETILRDHPEVRDAMVLCGAASADSPPSLEAYVAASEHVGALELTSWCRDRLSDFKIPRRWHVGADLPRNGSGKPDRKAKR